MLTEYNYQHVCGIDIKTHPNLIQSLTSLSNIYIVFGTLTNLYSFNTIEFIWIHFSKKVQRF